MATHFEVTRIIFDNSHMEPDGGFGAPWKTMLLLKGPLVEVPCEKGGRVLAAVKTRQLVNGTKDGFFPVVHILV